MTNKIMAIGVALLMVLVALTPVVSAGGYRPIAQFTMNGFGTLSITDLCHHNLFSKEMYIQRVVDGSVMPSFTNGARVDKLFYDKFEKVSGSLDVELGHDGTFVKDLAAGIYGVRLADGNGGQSEYAIVQIFDGQITRLTFVGHAVSGVGQQTFCIPVIVPEHTEYRFSDYVPAGFGEVCYPEVNHTVHHDEVNHTVIIPGDYHLVYVPEVNHTVHHDAVTHTEVNVSTWQQIGTKVSGNYDLVDGHYVYNHDHGQFDVTFTPGNNNNKGHYSKEGSNPHYYVYHDTARSNYYNPDDVTDTTKPVYGYVASGWMNGTCPYHPDCDEHPPLCDQRTVIDVLSRDEIVVDTPAYYETVADYPDSTGIAVDTPARDEIVVDTPARCDPVVITEGYWTPFSEWSTTLVEPIEGQRIVETRIVPESNSCDVPTQVPA